MCCSSSCFLVLLCTHYGPLQCFSIKFHKLKEIGALRTIFPDYVISCDYDLLYYYEKLAHSKLQFYREENLKKCTTFEEQKCTRYIRENFYFGIIVFSCLSSTKPCPRFLLIYLIGR